MDSHDDDHGRNDAGPGPSVLGHDLMLTAPDRFVDEVLSFLHRQQR